jgi:hypothetical protein
VDGDLGNRNTAEGSQALASLTNGSDNTGMGFNSLHGDSFGSFNTAYGVNALEHSDSINNTAVGWSALQANTSGDNNTAIGLQALVFNTIGSGNTAVGVDALEHNNGNSNTATGWQALDRNETGDRNTAHGYQALLLNLNGSFNTADGFGALRGNLTGSQNTAQGYEALFSNTTGSFGFVGNNNTADGFHALYNNTIGSNNIGLGNEAGSNLTTGNNNIDIGSNGVAGESGVIRLGNLQSATFIAGINGVAVSGVSVIVDANGQLGTIVSSLRFKDDIKPMDKASEAILSLKPVTFRYKHEIDPKNVPQFGLVAEDVEKVNPDLVVRDAKGKVFTVRYEAVNAMLLNEFLKEHKKVEELEATVVQLKTAAAQQQKDFTAHLKEQDAKIQKVNDKVELKHPAPQMVDNQ